MRYIPLRQNPPKQKWIDDANTLTQSLIAETDFEKQKEVIDKNSRVWGKLKQHLMKLSYNKCWYSEAREVYSHYHVDHFRPKKQATDINGIDQGGYWWLAFEWTNYRICGSVGNTKKGDRFCVLKNKAKGYNDPTEDEIIYFLDLTDEDDPLQISFDESGQAKPLSLDKDGWDYERARYTIDNLDLNYELLKEARRDLWDTCQSKLNELQNLMKQNNQYPSATKKAQIKSRMVELKELTKLKSEFSATAVTCLLRSDILWVQKLVSEAQREDYVGSSSYHC